MSYCNTRRIQKKREQGLGNGKRKISITGEIISEGKEKSQKRDLE